MDLQTPRRERVLKHQYTGRAVAAGGVLFRPLRIDFFEIAPSQLHEGRDMLVMQTASIDRDTGEIVSHPVMTESFSLIKTIRGTEDSLPHYTKIVRKRDGYLYFSKLNDEEKRNIII